MFKIIDDVMKGRKNQDWEKIKFKYNNSRMAKKLKEFKIPTDLGRFIFFMIVLSVLASVTASVVLGSLAFFATPGGACLGIIVAIVLFLKMQKK